MSNIEKLEKLMNTNWPDDTGKEVTIKYKKEDNCENEIKPLSRLRIIRDMQLPSGAGANVLINTENLPEDYSQFLLSISTELIEDIKLYDKENDIYESEKTGGCAFSNYYSYGNITIELTINIRNVLDKYNRQFVLLGNKYAEKIKKMPKEAASKRRRCSNNQHCSQSEISDG